ncbi:MAG: malectin domain-containing carbohydrate-binding protein [Dehalococcoidia bacterium]
MDRSFTVTVSDGTLNLAFTSVVDNASVSAIQIVPAGSPIRVNPGGGAYTDAGQAWEAEYGHSGGNTASTGAAIDSTTDQAIYQTERWGTSRSYAFPVPNGAYTVTLKFAEKAWTNPGQRVFHVAAEGVTKLSNFDIVAAAEVEQGGGPGGRRDRHGRHAQPGVHQRGGQRQHLGHPGDAGGAGGAGRGDRHVHLRPERQPRSPRRPAAPATTYAYDGLNRLTGITEPTTASYAYNGDGLRVGKTVGGVTTPYTWDALQGCRDRRPGAEYVRGHGLISRIAGGGVATIPTRTGWAACGC